MIRVNTMEPCDTPTNFEAGLISAVPQAKNKLGCCPLCSGDLCVLGGFSKCSRCGFAICQGCGDSIGYQDGFCHDLAD